jgi:multiple sugar transport system substrate-binding protein
MACPHLAPACGVVEAGSVDAGCWLLRCPLRRARSLELAAREPVTLTMWSHGGTPASSRRCSSSVRRWNSSQSASVVELVEVPEGDYGHTAQTAITARDCPTSVEVDGPLVASYAYQGALRPLEEHLDPAVVALAAALAAGAGDLRRPPVRRGRLRVERRPLRRQDPLAAAGSASPPPPMRHATAEEFHRCAAGPGLAGPRKQDPSTPTQLNYAWGVADYGSPRCVVGRRPISSTQHGFARGTWTPPTQWRQWRRWRPGGLRGRHTVTTTRLVTRRVPLSWVGHWPRRYAPPWDDLVLLPLPDLGARQPEQPGSWAWALSSSRAAPGASGRVLEFC